MIKAKTIKTDKATLLVVEIPDGGINPIVSMGYLQFRIPDYRNWVTDDIIKNPERLSKYLDVYNEESDYKDARPIRVPEGNWQLLGRLPDITEEQCSKVVDESIHSGLYAHYVKEVNPPNVYRYRSSRDSLCSLLQANDIYFDNKYGDERPPNLPVDADPYTSKKGYKKFREERKHLPPSDLMVSYEAYCMSWQEAQSKVWDRERTYLLIKED